MRKGTWALLCLICALAQRGAAAAQFTPRELVDQLGSERVLEAYSDLSEHFTENRPEIMAGLQHSNPRVRRRIIMLLHSKRNPAFFSDVRPLIHDPDPRVRGEVLDFASGLMGQAGKETLYIGLEDLDPVNRSGAVRSLGLMGGPNELALLNKLVNASTDTAMVGTAILVLASKGEKRVRARAIELLDSSEGFTRTNLIEALGYVGNADDLELLQTIATSSSEKRIIRTDAKRAIARLTFQLKNETAKHVEILEALRSEDFIKRRWAAGELMRRGDKASIAILKKAAGDPAHPGVAEASDALRVIRDRMQE